MKVLISPTLTSSPSASPAKSLVPESAVANPASGVTKASNPNVNPLNPEGLKP